MKSKRVGAALKIRVWMMSRGIAGQDIAKGYGCRPPVVCNFLQGKLTSKGLAGYMKKLGCPDDYFRNGRVAGQGGRNDGLSD